jgi:hypothetical protein
MHSIGPYELEFDEEFTGPDLDADRWVAHYLPQWTTPERSAARSEPESGVLRLRIDAGQPAWRPEDGEMRVSNLQTGNLLRAARVASRSDAPSS